MRKTKILHLFFFLFGTIQWIVLPGFSPAQSDRVSSTSASSGLTEKEMRGRGLFLQSCSLCHLPPPEFKPRMRQSSGPILNGLFKDAKPDKEKAVREVIAKGTQNMPGFRYSLSSQEMDDLVAFLKTLNDLEAYSNTL